MVTSQVVTVAATVSKQREGSVGPCLALSSLVLGLSLWISAGRIQGGSSVSASLFWGPPSKIYPEVCFHADSKPHRVDKISHHWRLRGDYENS